MDWYILTLSVLWLGNAIVLLLTIIVQRGLSADIRSMMREQERQQDEGHL